jgi:hypothetical protein
MWVVAQVCHSLYRSRAAVLCVIVTHGKVCERKRARNGAILRQARSKEQTVRRIGWLGALAVLPTLVCSAGELSPGLYKALQLTKLTLYTGELGLVCQWASEDAEQVHREVAQASTTILKDRILHGELTPEEVWEAQGAALSRVAMNLTHKIALASKAQDCRDRDWQSAWASFQATTRALPPQSPERYAIPEDRALHFAQLASQACIPQAITLLDDHISGADVIARAVSRACREELERVGILKLSGSYDASFAQRMTRDFLDSEKFTRELTEQVLEERAAGATNAN